MSKKGISIKLFRVGGDSAVANKFYRELKRIDKLPGSGSRARNSVVNGETFRCDRLDWRAEYNSIVGEMVRVRMRDLPIPISEEGVRRDINKVLPGNDGLGESTGFLYQPCRRILAIENRRSAVTISGFKSYFAARGVPMDLEPIPSEEGWERMKSMDEVRSFEMKFAVPDQPGAIVGTDEHVRGVMQLARNAEARVVTFQISMGHKKSSLSVRQLLSLVKQAYSLSSQGGDLKILRAKGKTHEGESSEANFLKPEVVLRYSFDTEDKKVFEWSIRRAHFLNKWKDILPYLEAMYKEKDVKPWDS